MEFPVHDEGLQEFDFGGFEAREHAGFEELPVRHLGGDNVPKRFGKEDEVEVQGDKLVIRSLRRPRQGWDKQFVEMASRGDDQLLDSEAGNLSSWDKDEWEWK